MTPTIFLSYTSQDAHAARRICDALQVVGLEVWFDQSELRGGDAWDASIRKQIKECTFFVPIISANTNEREEGYFRLEWKLAVDRSHLMADHKAFFLPVVWGDVLEATAHVPDKFRERQWSRLHDDKSISDFAARVQQIVSAAGVVTPQLSTAHLPASAAAELTGTSGTVSTAPVVSALNPSARRRTLIALTVVGVASVGGLAFWRPWIQMDSSDNAKNGVVRDPQLQRAIQLIESNGAIKADVALAEDLANSALTARPTDVEATLVMGRVQTYFLLRGFDLSEERFALAKRFAERGLAIAPDHPEAMATMAVYLFRRRIELARAASLLRDAISRRPDEPRYYRALITTMSITPGVSTDELIAVSKNVTERFPKDALAHYDLALHYRDASRTEEMLFHLDRAIALSSMDGAILLRARYTLYLDGDLDGAKARLDQLSDRYRSTDRAVFAYVDYALMSGNPAVGLKALIAIPEAWMNDFHYTGPTQLLAGELLLLQDKIELAKVRFESALVDLGNRKLHPAQSLLRLWLEAWLNMRLGRLNEARAANMLLVKESPRPYRVRLDRQESVMVLGAVRLNLLLDERANALVLIREAAEDKLGRLILRTTIRLDPRLARFRDDAEIRALLADPDNKK